MKKVLFAALGLIIALHINAYAAIGDIAGNIYSTDILTEIDGVPIGGYAVEGETMIALEDLKDYGFNVYYNDNVRTLFVTKSGQPTEDFSPKIERGTVGKMVGHYYETDIVAYVNSIKVPTYAIDGKLVISVEQLAKWTGSSQILAYVPEGEFFAPKFFFEDAYYMTYQYDDSKRLLSLITIPHSSLSRDSVGELWLGMNSPWRVTRECVLHNDKYIYLSKTLGGIMGGPAKYRKIICENGMVLDALQYIRAYGLHSHMNTYTEIYSPVFSIDGESLYFVHKYDGGQDYKQLNISNGHIKPLEEADYKAAANHIKKSDYEIYIDDIKLPLYSIGGRDYVCAEDMQVSGFTVNFDEISKALCIVNNGTKNSDYTVSTLPEGEAVPAGEDITLFLNGGHTEKHNMYYYEGVYLLPVESFTYDEYTYGLGTIKYVYDIKNKRINAKTSEDTKLNYNYDDYDLSRKQYPYKVFYAENAKSTYDSGDEYETQVVAFENDVYIKISNSVIHGVSEQLKCYLNNKGISDSDVFNDKLSFEYDGEYITYKIEGTDYIRYNALKFEFEMLVEF